jgi:alkanesulfonate monooxygenase SsuD/methylene tetrahydromethanopterin reductase-like flavin-dependent oxidoreductase (luciferase family)
MSNYPIRFGFCLPIFAWPSARLFRTPGFAVLDTQRCMQLGALAEQLGYDSLWAADHLMLGHEDAILEGWTVLAAMAGMTHKAQLGIIHYNNVFRHPAFTAKMVSTLDQISNGRMIHFVDLGNNSREYLSYGMHEDDARERRIAQMVEGLELTLRLWSATEPLTFSGTHYFTKDAICNPKPVQEPCPKIWMGEVHPALIDATVKYADAWNSVPVPMSELRKRIEMLDEACVAAERDPKSLERTLEIQILIAPTIDALRSKLKTLLALAPSGESPLPDMAAFVSGATDELPEELRESWWAGTPDMVCDRVAECIDLGFTHFMGWFVDAPDDSGMRLFAEQVAPKFRA